MDMLQAVILGLIQGVTEFLPISSSGHLVLARYLFGWPEIPLTFDILLHGGSLAAIIVYFWPRIKILSPTYLRWLIIGSTPAGLAGVLFESMLDAYFDNWMMLVIGWLLTGAILLYVDRLKPPKTSATLTDKKAFAIGLFQALALLPSLSRSGSTIAGALQQRLSRQEAFNFSFLLSIPALLGAVILKIFDIGADQVNLVPLSLGISIAFVSGLLALRVLEQVVINAKLKYFAYYCFALSVLVLLINFPLQK